MIPCQRHLFDIPEDVTYLNCAYMGPLLKSAHEAGKQALNRKLWPWTLGASDFFSEIELLREQLAQVINAQAGDIALVPSVSYGIQIAAANLAPKPGQNVIVLEDQFPSNVYPWRALVKKNQAELRTVARPSDGDWTSAVLQAMDQNTAICALPNVHWTDGSLVDLMQVGRRCRQLGAALVVDATQSVGVMPFDVEQIKPDFLVVGLYKWMLGPYSLGFVYASPQRQDGSPLEENWINRKDAEDFAGLVAYRDEYQAGARRYDMGEKSNFFLLPVAVAALKQILEWQVDEIAATLSVMTGEITRRARELGYTVPDQDKRGPHLLGIGFPPGTAGQAAQRLAAEKIMVSVRGNAMRVAPHLYNTEKDIDRLITALAR